MTLHLEKKAIRVLGIAESFSQRDLLSTLAGVVMRSDLVVDGAAFGSLQVAGSDATESIIALFRKMKRNDINVLMIAGSVLSLYNVVDLEKIGKKLKLPVVAVSFTKSRADLERNVKAKFDRKTAERKIRLLRKLGKASTIRLKTGYVAFVRSAGTSDQEIRILLDRFTLQGAVAEPLRVAKLLARAARAFVKRV